MARLGWSDARSNLTLAASSPVVSIKKHKNDDDDDDNNNDDNHHGKGKKNNDGDAGLSECTIIQPGGGGGCKTGLKWVCEKMKSGNKCCGCVADKSKGTSAGQSGGDGKTSSGGIKPVDENAGRHTPAPLLRMRSVEGEYLQQWRKEMTGLRATQNRSEHCAKTEVPGNNPPIGIARVTNARRGRG